MKYLYNSNVAISLFAHGLIAILVGSIFIFATVEIFKIMVLITSIIFGMVGIILILKAFFHKNRETIKIDFIPLFLGAFLLSLGLFIMFNLEMMSNMIILFFGIVMSISGINQLYLGIVGRKTNKFNKGLIINGIAILILGLTIAISQEHFVGFLGKLIGWVSVLAGAIAVVFGIIYISQAKKANTTDDQLG
jgi:uncharacterized membrane protein HdeD (DUF308 family)